MDFLTLIIIKEDYPKMKAMEKRNIDRRRFIETATTTGAASLALTIPAFGKFSTPISKSYDHGLRPVNVSDRVIRTVVGLRPYRPSGCVLKRKK